MITTMSKTAVKGNVGRAPSLFYSSAREGMEDLLRSVIGTSGGRVLLPAYIGWSPREGSGVFDPIRNLKLEHDFYPLNSDLSADVENVVGRLSAGDVAVVVVIHYFGRTDPGIADITAAAREAGVIVIEDLAHGFFSAQCGYGAGRHGDVNLYSLHKMFPLGDGGMVTYRNSRLLTSQRGTRPDLAKALLDFDWARIARTRRRNFEKAVAAFGERPGHGIRFELMWDFLQNGDVPQTLPLRVIEGDRDELYAELNARGIGMVSLYHTLIEETRGVFPAVDQNSRSVINFPVHQDIDPNEIPEAVRVFDEILASMK